jgi:hypothetical protein
LVEQNGYEGFLETLNEDRQMTQGGESAGFTNFVREWWSKYREDWVTVKNLAALAQQVDSFEVRKSDVGKVSVASLGRMLSKRRGMVIDGITLQGPHERDGRSVYRLVGTPTWDVSQESSQPESDLF